MILAEPETEIPRLRLLHGASPKEPRNCYLHEYSRTVRAKTKCGCSFVSKKLVGTYEGLLFLCEFRYSLLNIGSITHKKQVNCHQARQPSGHIHIQRLRIHDCIIKVE